MLHILQLSISISEIWLLHFSHVILLFNSSLLQTGHIPFNLRKQELLRVKSEHDEHKRLERLTNSDNRAFTMYDKIHDRMLQR